MTLAPRLFPIQTSTCPVFFPSFSEDCRVVPAAPDRVPRARLHTSSSTTCESPIGIAPGPIRRHFVFSSQKCGPRTDLMVHDIVAFGGTGYTLWPVGTGVGDFAGSSPGPVLHTAPAL